MPVERTPFPLPLRNQLPGPLCDWCWEKGVEYVLVGNLQLTICKTDHTFGREAIDVLTMGPPIKWFDLNTGRTLRGPDLKPVIAKAVAELASDDDEGNKILLFPT